MNKKPWVVASAVAAALSVLTAVRASADTLPSWAAGLPQCRALAVAHQDGTVLASQPPNGPVACGMLNGWPTVETRIEVTNAGAVIQEPAILAGGPFLGGGGHTYGWAGGQGLARTFDEGRTWNAVRADVWPLEQLYITNDGVDCNLYVDHDTGRLFFYIYNSFTPVTQTFGFCGGGGGATVAFSDDSGTTWEWGFDNAHDCAENPTVLTGKPTVSNPTQMSYPNVVYLCGDNTSLGAAGAGSPGNSCSKSLDGGRTWFGTSFYGLGPTKTVGGTAWPLGGPQGFYTGSNANIPGCSSPSFGAGAQPLSDGTLLIAGTCGGSATLIQSTDEGGSWTVKTPLPHGGSLRVDSAGNLYLLRSAGGGGSQLPLSGGGATQLFLSHSADGGATWSTERNMIGPDVVSAGTTFFAQGTYQAGRAGDVAVMYYGIRTGNTTSDGFITETRDALSDNPTFWTGQVNDPSHPLLYNTGTSNQGITVLDFIGGAFSPDGRSVWASFVQDCGPNLATSPECQRRLPAGNPVNPQDGFAGRLVWPQ